jgi:tetratricopeptide (TPR) repeat protein
LQQADAAFRAGYTAASNGDLAAARQQFQRAVQLAPQIEEGHSALGAVLYQQGDYNDAIRELELVALGDYNMRFALFLEVTDMVILGVANLTMLLRDDNGVSQWDHDHAQPAGEDGSDASEQHG